MRLDDFRDQRLVKADLDRAQGPVVVVLGRPDLEVAALQVQVDGALRGRAVVEGDALRIAVLVDVFQQRVVAAVGIDPVEGERDQLVDELVWRAAERKADALVLGGVGAVGFLVLGAAAGRDVVAGAVGILVAGRPAEIEADAEADIEPAEIRVRGIRRTGIDRRRREIVVCAEAERVEQGRVAWRAAD